MRVERMAEQDSINRYLELKATGREILSQSSVVKEGIVTRDDILLAKQVMIEGAKLAPPVSASFWEHVTVAPEMGKRVAREASKRDISVNPDEVEFLLWLHEAGRIVEPPAYLRESLIGDRLLKEFGIPKKTIDKLDSIVKLTQVAEEIGELTEAQLRFAEPYTQDQERIAESYFGSLTPTQRVIKLADNLGKRDPDNNLFDLTIFRSYLKTQENRYPPDSPWPSIRWSIPIRRDAAVLQANLVEKILNWLNMNGVDFDKIHEGLADYGPRFVIFVRHGEVIRPASGIVYNNDEVAINFGRPEDVVHISEEGQKQMFELGEVINDRGFNISRIIPSNQVRAKESAKVLADSLSMEVSPGDERFKDFVAPGIMAEEITWDELKKISGNLYDEDRWVKKHGHETPDKIIERMAAGFWDSVRKLGLGKAAVIISHGDSSAWLLNYLQGKKPEPKDLRKSTYPPKGSATVVITDPKDPQEIFAMYPLAGWDEERRYIRLK